LLSLLQTSVQTKTVLKIAQASQTQLLPNNQSDAQEFDGCIASANQKMSYFLDDSQPIRIGLFIA
jgi:hypothetical protein